VSGLPGVPAGGAVATAGSGSATRARHWIAFFALALGVIVADQLSKAWVVASFPFGQPVNVIGEWIRIWRVANNGALFGLFRDQALVFAALSIAVMALIVWYHGRAIAGNGWLATIALGLLLGGAVGNFLDRVRLGSVVDFVDMGFPGGWRFYTWNVADAAISTAILLLLVMALLPAGRRGARAG
jgi:signal peptidase II